MAEGAKPDTQAQRIADLQAQITQLKEEIEGLEQKIEDLETEAENREALRPPFERLLGDIDALFGIRHLPVALRLSLDAFDELL